VSEKERKRERKREREREKERENLRGPEALVKESWI
jgi:hypothetical protein